MVGQDSRACESRHSLGRKRPRRRKCPVSDASGSVGDSNGRAYVILVLHGCPAATRKVHIRGGGHCDSGFDLNRVVAKNSGRITPLTQIPCGCTAEPSLRRPRPCVAEIGLMRPSNGLPQTVVFGSPQNSSLVVEHVEHSMGFNLSTGIPIEFRSRCGEFIPTVVDTAETAH
jgi:hypothetical protein